MLLLATLVGAVGGSQLASRARSASPTASSAPTSAPGSTQPLPTPSTGGSSRAALSTEQIAAAVDPAIVNIDTTLAGGAGAGTGMVLTSGGLVLTNNHVIADATSIRAQVGGAGKTYEAAVLGYDTTEDVALLQLQGASGLPTITPGDSAQVRVGDAVVALGNALGRGGTAAVATGNVTALDQDITVSDETGQNEQSLSGLIQIDAPLQPGDSGGPLVDRAGRVIGMDTAASASFRRQRSAEGYAIPIDFALGIAKQIQAGTPSAKVHIGDRALLGVQISDGSQSAQVVGVQPGGPADDAGITAGDVITGVDSSPVSDGASLRAALDPFRPGDTVTVTWEDSTGQRQSARVTLVKGPPA